MGKSRQKIQRMRTALDHREGDRVPVGEFYWTGFLKQCRRKWGDGFDPYRHFDLDYIVITPNMDPRIQPFEIVEQSGQDIVVKTGFGATIRRRGDVPMPHYETFSVKRPEAMADVELDDPADPRRFYSGGDDQINCVGDALARDLPSWEDRLRPYTDDFAVFGSVCEPYEYLWRIIGSENALYWMATDADLFNAFVDRLGKFLLDFADAQIQAGEGRLSGMYIWGDVAYVNGMLFGAPRWREVFKPHVKALIDLCHRHGLMAIYHGCGDARAILGDMVEIGLDAYNPLEAKAHLDVVELKKTYAGKLAFVGNIDVRVLESGDPEKIRRETRYKLQAARGGGWVFQSDHSISSSVTPESYELAIRMLREAGNYPLDV
jgi:uroporphyrinogen decarboxylase